MKGLDIPDISAPGEKENKVVQPNVKCPQCGDYLDKKLVPAICPKCGARTMGGIREKTIQTGPFAAKDEPTPMQKRFLGLNNKAAQVVPLQPQPLQPQPLQPQMVPQKPKMRPNKMVDVMVDPDLLDEESRYDQNHHQNVSQSAEDLGL